jgi:hypothetical protein
MRYAGAAQPQRIHLRLVDNSHITDADIRRAMRPRRRWNPWKLLGNMAMMVFASLSMSVLVWAGVVWLTGW